MTASDFIVDVSEADFEYQVVAFSQETPVVVDFWAEWCGPCKTLGPLLERMAQEAKGAFRLAKVNVDENPTLARRFNVRSIPMVKAFRDGAVVAEFVGVQPEPRLREFLRGLAPSQDDLVLEKASSLVGLRQAGKAEELFRQVLEGNPEHAPALLGLAKSLLMQGKAGEAQLILQDFPASKEFSKAESLRPVAAAMNRAQSAGLTDDELDAAYTNALRLVERGNLPAALDGLLDVLRQDKRYRGGEARQVFIGVLELLGEGDPLSRQYRSELASVLF